MKIDAPHRAFRLLDVSASELRRFRLRRLRPRRRCWDGLHGLPFVLCVVAATLFQPCIAQQTNLDRLSLCSQRLCDSLLASFRPGDSLCVSVTEHPAAWVLDQAALGIAATRGFHAIGCDGSKRAQIALAITEIGVDYREIDDPDSLQRTVHMACSAVLTSPSGSQVPAAISVINRIERSLQDTIAEAEVATLEAPGYDYTKGTRLTQTASGFWSRVVEPAVVLGSAAVMVILLFTVRSQ